MFEEALLEKVDICNEILKDCRNELYLNLRFLDVALHSLVLEPSMSLGAATDGAAFCYNPEYLIELYKVGNVQVNRCYLHSILHCLFGHVWKKREEQELLYWNLACDIAVEYILDGLPLRCLRNPPKPYRRAVYEGLLKKIPVIHGEGVFHLLQDANPDMRIVARMVQEFTVDSHMLWQKDGSGPKSPIEQQKDRKSTRLNSSHA